MNAIKKIMLLSVAFGFLFVAASCNKNTCPTYSKASEKHTEVRA